MMVRIRYFTSQPCCTKSRASQSNSASLEGGFVARRSSTGSTRPRPILRLAGDPEVVRRPLLEPAPTGQHQLAGELVPWLVLRHALPDPAVERVHPFVR